LSSFVCIRSIDRRFLVPGGAARLPQVAEDAMGTGINYMKRRPATSTAISMVSLAAMREVIGDSGLRKVTLQ
jgi:hypothetical protein